MATSPPAPMPRPSCDGLISPPPVEPHTRRRTKMKASTLLLGALAVALPMLTTSQPAAAADDWKTKYKEIVFASIPAENASGVMERYQPFADYLAKELGVKVTVRVASDYTAVIEGQKAGNIHIA